MAIIDGFGHYWRLLAIIDSSLASIDVSDTNLARILVYSGLSIKMQE